MYVKKGESDMVIEHRENEILFNLVIEMREVGTNRLVLRQIKAERKNGAMQYRTLGDSEDATFSVKLLPLEGSEKQIAWAEDIRYKKVVDTVKKLDDMGIDNVLSEAKEMDGSINTYQDAADYIFTKMEERLFLNETSAKNIIEKRDDIWNYRA